MQIANLHSLLSGYWSMNEEYRQAMLPYLSSVLKGTPITKIDAPAPLFLSEQGSTEIISEDSKESYVAVLSIKSPIYKYSQECGPRGTKALGGQLADWSNDSRIIGVVLDIDSGGGQVSGTAEFAAQINSYTKPIVTYTDGYLCSAAYHIGSASQQIIMSKHAEAVGSIGTMLYSINMEGYYKKRGAQIIEAYATKSTKKNNGIRKAKEGDLTALIKEELDPFNERFHADIKKYRPNINEEVFTGDHYNDLEKAQRLGLIDRIGTLNDAVATVIELSNKKTTKTNKKMKTYPAIDAALGNEEGQKLSLSSGLFSKSQGSKLSEEALDALESRLTELEADSKKVSDAVKAQKTAETDLENLETAITTAATDAEVKEGKTAMETIKELSSKITEYGEQPGSTPTTAGAAEEDIEVDNDDGVVDPTASHNKNFETA